MKKIKIKFIGFYEGFDPTRFLMFQIINKYYDVEISDDPDYIICSESGNLYEYCVFPQVRIMYTGENFIPDFNLVDYAICNYPIAFLDRSFYLPLCVGSNSGHGKYLDEKSRDYSKDILKEKTYFANFISGHDSEYGLRSDFFQRISAYKRVESPGTFLNNMPEGEIVKFKDESKVDFQHKCKFSLCLESTKSEGFVTEKIADAFFADTIPIYYGSATVSDIFNRKAFINLSEFESFDKAIEKIVEIDKNDDMYMEMLREPIFNEQGFVKKTLKAYEEYLRYIFDQPLDKAYRRSRVYTPKRYNDFFYDMHNQHNKNTNEKKSIKNIVSRIIH